MSDAVTDAVPQAEPAKPTRWQQIRAWIATGTQSIGGGPSTLYLMRSIFVGRGWLTEREFLQEWTLSRLSPGNHLTALAALVGQRLGGGRGVALAMTGLLVPSAIITIALTGAFELIRDNPAVTAALAGVGPVTIGMMLGISAMMLRSVIRPILPGAALDAALFAAAMTAGFLVPEATIAVIVAGAIIGVAFMGHAEIPREAVEE